MSLSRNRKRLNVLYLIRTWAFGGSHTIILLLLKHLPEDRFNIVCVPYETPSNADESFVREAQRRGLSVSDDRIPWQSRLNWRRARARVTELIDKHTIDLIHTHDTHSNVLVGLSRTHWPCACVASAYGWWNSVLPIRRRVYQGVERMLALPRFERVITVSDHMKGKVLRGGRISKDRVRVIHTGVDLSPVSREATGREVRAQFGISDEACVVGTVSRVSPEKGHCHLLDAAASLVSRYPRLHVLIVGNGPARPSLEAQTARLGISGHVTFAGFVDALPPVLAAMDIFVQPSVLEEGFPTSVLEAQVAGLPVVASDIGGTRETMDVDTTGLLARPGDAGSLAEALELLVGDPERRRAMRKAAPAWIRRSFTLEHMVEQVSDTYQEAIDAYGATSKGPRV
jgi:glycosyltransferase involved in cell wall biosynthesis